MQAPNFAYGLTARKFLALDVQPQLDLSCVRHMINAAEPVDAASIDRFYAVFEAHGLKRSECSVYCLHSVPFFSDAIENMTE